MAAATLRSFRLFPTLLGLALCALPLPLTALRAEAHPQLSDSDHDGLTDALEQQLLQQFRPTFMVSAQDCSTRPAAFNEDQLVPQVHSQDGTIYGQAFPSKQPGNKGTLAELHFYHLWGKDCGAHGHALDAEHVAVLVQASDAHLATATWKALYWYAAAHEDTVCDVSQIARASTLHAEDHGATVWVSPGKHASYLDPALCHHGCGADRCTSMSPLAPASLINLGEPGHPMNGSAFIASNAWPLAAKMGSTNFPSEPIERLNQLPVSDIAWFRPGRHPAQGVIARSSATEQSLANSSDATASALSSAGASTGNALSTASDNTGAAMSQSESATGNALEHSYKSTRHALGSSAKHVGNALRLTPRRKPETPQ